MGLFGFGKRKAKKSKAKSGKKRRAPSHPAMRAQQSKMKSCAIDWNHSKRVDKVVRGLDTYAKFMKDCLGK